MHDALAGIADHGGYALWIYVRLAWCVCMRTFLLVTDTVHTSATLCDYLDARLAADDHVVALALLDDPADSTPEGRRDRQDALNAVAVRLAARATVETELIELDDDRAATLRTDCVDRAVDELVCGVSPPSRDDASVSAVVGSDLLADPPCPLVLVPLGE